MSELPGKDGQEFHIKLNKDWFKVGDTIVASRYECIVTKVYPYNWWRKFLNKPFFRFFGIYVKMMEIKVKPTHYSTIDDINNEQDNSNNSWGQPFTTGPQINDTRDSVS